MVDVTLSGLTVGYGGRPVLNRMDATLKSGTVTALIGPNGAGKSTCLKAIAGLLPATGRIDLDGIATEQSQRRAKIAYMPQDTSAVSSLTLLEVVLLGRLKSLGMRLPSEMVGEASAALERFGLGSLANRTLDAVSGGQRQLVYLAQALFRRPQVLLLDEPTAALDLRHQLVVLETVRNMAGANGITVAIAMHDLSLAAQFSDSMLCLSGGKVDSHGPARDVLTPARLARLYGVEAEILSGRDDVIRITPIRAL